MKLNSPQFAETVYRLLGFILIPALFYLTTLHRAPPGLALGVAVIWIVSYFYRFTREPENIIPATTAVIWLGLALATLAIYVFNEDTQDKLFIGDLRAICGDMAEPDAIEHDFCDRLEGAIGRYLHGEDTGS